MGTVTPFPRPTPEPEPPMEYLTVAEVAARLRLKPKTLHCAFSELRQGRGGLTGERWRGLEPVKVGGRWLIPAAAVERVIAGGERPGQPRRPRS